MNATFQAIASAVLLRTRWDRRQLDAHVVLPRGFSVTLRFLALRLALWLACGFIGLHCGDLAAESPPNAGKPLNFVFEVDRSGKHDLLFLKDGQKLTGKALNESFTIRTPYARLKLDRRMVAGIDASRSLSEAVAVLTVNSNRVTGFIEDAAFLFEPDGASRRSFRQETVARLICAIRDDELAGIPQRRWMVLRNGDMVRGDFKQDPLVLLSSGAQIAIPASNVLSLVSTANKLPIRIHPRNGEVIRGTLLAEDIEWELDLGRPLTLYFGAIDYIADRLMGADRENVSALQSDGSTNFEGMVWIPAGEFMMGSPYDEAGRDRDEGPQTRVVLTNGFWMGRCEVTQAEYERVMGGNPSNNTENPAQPVEKVSWFEAVDYCARLNRLEEAAGRLPQGYAFRLPTEAEWEYACRAGTTSRFSFGDDRTDSKLIDYAWFTENSESSTHAVGKKRPNPWGLHDMHGNVWEWCLDRWESTLSGGVFTNAPVKVEGILRVARGGSWLYEASACRSANRDDYSPANRCADLGFRVVLAPAP